MGEGIDTKGKTRKEKCARRKKRKRRRVVFLVGCEVQVVLMRRMGREEKGKDRREDIVRILRLGTVVLYACSIFCGGMVLNYRQEVLQRSESRWNRSSIISRHPVAVTSRIVESPLYRLAKENGLEAIDGRAETGRHVPSFRIESANLHLTCLGPIRLLFSRRQIFQSHFFVLTEIAQSSVNHGNRYQTLSKQRRANMALLAYLTY